MQQTVLSKKSSIISKILLSLLLSVLLFLLFNYIDSTFRVKTIILNRSKSETSLFGMSALKDKSTLFTTKDSIVNSIKNKNPQVKQVVVKIIYPSTLKLDIEFNSDFINMETNNGYFILDNNGKILEKRRMIQNNLPILTYFQKIDYSSFQPGDIINYSDIKLSLYFVENVEELGMSVNTVDISSLYMIRLKMGEKTVLFSTEKEKEIQVYELNSILKRYQSEGGKYKTIDLRFDKPVLKI